MNLIKRINIVVGLVSIILLLIAGVYLQKLLKTEPDNVIPMQVAEGCDLATQACVAKLADKTVSLKLSQPVRYLQKITLSVTTTGFETAAIGKMLLDFSMTDMQMGINRFALNYSQAQQSWQGLAMIPVCVSGRRDWQARLYLQTAGQTYLALFNLTVEN